MKKVIKAICDITCLVAALSAVTVLAMATFYLGHYTVIGGELEIAFRGLAGLAVTILLAFWALVMHCLGEVVRG